LPALSLGYGIRPPGESHDGSPCLLFDRMERLRELTQSGRQQCHRAVYHWPARRFKAVRQRLPAARHRLGETLARLAERLIARTAALSGIGARALAGTGGSMPPRVAIDRPRLCGRRLPE
jgi:hypothetical protein